MFFSYFLVIQTNKGGDILLLYLYFSFLLVSRTRNSYPLYYSFNCGKEINSVQLGRNSLISGLGGGPVVGREYLSLLEQHSPQLHWEKNSAEHFFLYIDNQNIKHVVFYPSLMSIAMRLQEAISWGAGISIWEIGQGLEYFFDIL